MPDLPTRPTLRITGVLGWTPNVAAIGASTVTIAGTIDPADAGQLVSLYDGSSLLGTVAAGSTGAWSLQVTLPSTIGAQALSADGAGLASAVFDYQPLRALYYSSPTVAAAIPSSDTLAAPVGADAAGDVVGNVSYAISSFALPETFAYIVKNGVFTTITDGLPQDGSYVTAMGVDAAGDGLAYFSNASTGVTGYFLYTAAGAYDPLPANFDAVGVDGAGDVFGNQLGGGASLPAELVAGSITTTALPFSGLAGGPQIIGVDGAGDVYGELWGLSPTEGFVAFAGAYDQVQTISVPDATGTYVAGVNEAGYVWGTYGTASGANGSFVESGGAYTMIAAPNYAGQDSTTIEGVTSAGLVYGTYQDSSLNQYGFTEQNGLYTTITVPGATSTDLQGVTDAGVYYGNYVSNQGEEGFLAQNGVFSEVAVDNPTNSLLFGVDDAGEVVGFYTDTTNSVGASFTMESGQFTPLSNELVFGIDGAGDTWGVSFSGGAATGFVDANGVVTSYVDPSTASTNILGTIVTGVFGAEICGIALVSTGAFSYAPQAFVESNGSYQAISIAGAQRVFAMGGNAAANVVYGFFLDADGLEHGFLYNIGSGNITTIDDPNAGTTANSTGLPSLNLGVFGLSLAAGSGVTGMDAAGNVYGTYVDGNGVGHGFEDVNGVFTTIDAPGASSTIITNVADNGDIVGGYTVGAGTNYVAHGFVDAGGVFTIYDTPAAAVPMDVSSAVAPGQTIFANIYPSVGLATITPETQDALRDDFNGDGASDLLLENSAGAVATCEVVSGVGGYRQVAGLGAEWSFEGNGDFLGDGGEDFLIEDASGALVVGEVANGATSYTPVGGLGSEWSIVGTGDYLNNGQDQFLMENSNGVVDVGDVVGGLAQYAQVGGLGSEWSVEGSGDFLGDGEVGFLMENASGVVDVGEVSSGTTSFRQIGNLGPEWKFVGSGDFLGNGQDQFLIESTFGSTAGALVVADVVNDQAMYTQVGALGSEWSFLGAGDYTGTGTASFMIENASGAVMLGTIAGGQASYAQVGALGAEWASRS